MPKYQFEPVDFEDSKDRRLRPLFTGRLANAFDSIANAGSFLFSAFVLVGGIILLAVNLYLGSAALVSRGDWLWLLAVVGVFSVVVFFIWRASFPTRLVILFSLALLSFVAAPFIERALAW